MNLGEKILEKAVDVVLVAIFFNMELLATKRKDWQKLEIYVENDLEEFDYEKIKRSIAYLRKKGLIQSGKEKFDLPQITQAGQRKLTSILPQYDEKRVWSKRVYLITYDLPVNKNKERNYLRFFLKKIGCGMLQKSVWVTPYNPTKLIDEFTKEKSLSDLILVSSLGKDGTVGNLDLKDLFVNVYKLRKLNEEYREFILNVKKNKSTKDQLVFNYLNILGRDPQLPFQLLPEWWLGDTAYNHFNKITR